MAVDELYEALKNKNYRKIGILFDSGHEPSCDFLYRLHDLMANIDESLMPEAESLFFIANHVLLFNYHLRWEPDKFIELHRKLNQKVIIWYYCLESKSMKYEKNPGSYSSQIYNFNK